MTAKGVRGPIYASDDGVASFHAEIFAAIKTQTRKGVAELYETGLMIRPLNQIDWWTINHAIIERWSPAGLLYVKNLAWKRIVEATRRAAHDALEGRP